ncbi:choice-of-anchor D domain-containing protein [Kribbella sp. NPDC023972]|uniref:choice-of-anchor D domain-containing protein n=1 Tax=Kribbella sp. NPDC023972 TaxID=3154795 RepID=UPI0033D5EF0D
MRRARRPALFRYALAAALAAITIPFLAHAAFGDETVTAPTAQVFPTRQGIGVTWTDVDASGYRVERKQGTADWQDISGPLTDSTTTWIDETIPAGTTADYRVATTGTDPATSPEVKATRVAEAPSVGDTDVLVLNAHHGAGDTWLRDETAGPVTASAPDNGSRILSAGSLKLRIPALLSGPGYIFLPATKVELTQGDRSCTTWGELWVTAVTYTPDLALETLTANLQVPFCGGTTVRTDLDIRFRSTAGYQNLSVTPDRPDFGRVMTGKSSSDVPITVKNTGTEPVKIVKAWLNTGAGNDWALTSNNCPATLPVAASCALTMQFRPRQDGPYSARLTIDDTTTSGMHSVLATGTGVQLPTSMGVSVAGTFTGHTVTWASLQASGGTPVRGYYLHRYLNGAETTQWIAAVLSAKIMSVADADPPAGVEYAVSVVNEVGEGPTGPRTAPGRVPAQLAIIQGEPTAGELMAASLSGWAVPLPGDSTADQPKEAVASAPDGRSLAYVTNTGERVLWSRRLDPDGLGAPVQLWTSSAAITHLSWSPDGTRIAFQAPENDTPCVYVIPAAGGTPAKVACDITSPSWMPDAASLIVVDRRLTDDRIARIEAKPGGTRLKTMPAPVAPADGTPVRVSPDGNWVAFGSGTAVQVIDSTSLTPSTGPSLGATVRSISWDPDGGQLVALTDAGRIFQLGVTLGKVDQPAVRLGPDKDEARLDLAWQRLGVTIAPTPAVVGPQTSVAFDASALLPGTTFTCRILALPSTPCTSPYVADIVSSGENTVAIVATEPDGRVTKALRTLNADVRGPEARMTGPGYQASVAATATLTVSATDANGVASYDVRYRRATSAGAYGAYVQPWTNTTATSMNLAVAAGYEYCVSVRAKDKLGNVGQWSVERCFSRPLDDRSLTLASTGWTRATGSAFYYGTTTQTTAYGKSLTRTVQGKRFFLVATRCPTCGSVAVYAGNRYLTTVNLAYPTTHRQILLGLPVQSTLFSGTLKLVSASTGKLVQIDGLAVGRT